jgi:hypothetical protein
MKISYTHKLFFGRFHRKITIQVEGMVNHWNAMPTSVSDLQNWCTQHLPPHEFKVRCREFGWDTNQNHKTYHVHIYYSLDQVQQQVLSEFGSKVIHMCAPLDQQHVDDLSVKNIIQVRDTLLYNKYSHVIYFKYQKNRKLHSWLTEYLADTDVKITHNHQFPIVYMPGADHMALLQITWADEIDHVKQVRLLTD